MARCKLKASLIGTSCVGFSFLKGEEKTTEERRDDARDPAVHPFLHCALWFSLWTIGIHIQTIDHDRRPSLGSARYGNPI